MTNHLRDQDLSCKLDAIFFAPIICSIFNIPIHKASENSNSMEIFLFNSTLCLIPEVFTFKSLSMQKMTMFSRTLTYFMNAPPPKMVDHFCCTLIFYYQLPSHCVPHRKFCNLPFTNSEFALQQSNS